MPSCLKDQILNRNKRQQLKVYSRDGGEISVFKSYKIGLIISEEMISVMFVLWSIYEWKLDGEIQDFLEQLCLNKDREIAFTLCFR